jgi:hypothetical protein
VAAVIKAWGRGEAHFDDWAERYATIEFGKLRGLKLVRVRPCTDREDRSTSA